MRNYYFLLFVMLLSIDSYCQNFMESSEKAQVFEQSYWECNFDAQGDFDWSATINQDSLVVIEKLPAYMKVVDETGNDFYWHWTNIGPRGSYFSASSVWSMWNNQDKENGALVLEMSYFNSDENNETPMNSFVQFGPIDLSFAQNSTLLFNQFFRECCQNSEDLSKKLNLEVSVNYNPTSNSGEWLVYDVRQDALMSIGLPSTKHACRQYLGDVVDGEKDVYLRFRAKFHTHYFWLLDDLKIVNAPLSGINDKVKEDVVFYPNPARDVIVVDSKVGSMVTIRDLSGRILLRQAVSEMNKEISLSSLFKGTYIVELTGLGSSTKVSKLVKD